MLDPPPLTLDIGLTLGVAAAAMVLFIWNRWSIEVVGLLTMVTLVLLGLVSPQEGVAGFANEATVTVTLMMGLSAALVQTGAVDLLGRWIGRRAGYSEWRLLVAILALVVPVSALINNTAAVAILLPMVVGLSRGAEVAPSRLLMPLSFGSQLGGTLTLIGTSTNLLVAGMALDLGLQRLSIFAVTPAALVLAVLGVGYLLTAGRWLTPRRSTEAGQRSSRSLRKYLTELEIEDDSVLLGHDVGDPRLEREFGLEVVGVWRQGEEIATSSDESFAAGDRILVRGTVENIGRAAAGDRLGRTAGATEAPAAERGRSRLEIAELMVTARSGMVGQRLADVRLMLPDSVEVLAIERHGAALVAPIGAAELEPGDILLTHGPRERLRSLHREGDLALLGVVELPEKRSGKMPLAIVLLSSVVLLAATGVTTILVAALVGLLAMVLTGCVTVSEVYDGVDWQVVVLLGSLLALGTAMQQSGAAEFLAAHMLELTRSLGPRGTLAGLYLLTVLVTSVVSNNASAIVLTPVAVAMARSLAVSPLPFVVAVMLAASNCFITPIGYQTNTFIYGPGGFRFADFLRVGGPLVLVLTIAAAWAVPWVFPF